MPTAAPAPSPAPSRAPQRSRRELPGLLWAEWAFALLFAVLTIIGIIFNDLAGNDGPLPWGLTLRTVATSTLAIVLSIVIPPLRRAPATRWRTALHIIAVLSIAISAAAAVPAGLALVRLSRARSPLLDAGLLIAVILLSGAHALLGWWYGENELDVVLLVAIGFIAQGTAALLMLGHIQGHQAEALTLLEEQADADHALAAAAERERDAIIARTRAEERNRIARDMHDSLSHQLSVIALHAGALSMREDLSPNDIRHAAGTIRSSAESANSELRLVLAALRHNDPGADTAWTRASTLRDVVANAYERGLEVSWTLEGITEREFAASPLFKRSAMVRIAEEAMLNAMKHAPGEPLRAHARLHGGVLELTARNRIPPDQSEALSSGYGLIGVQERATILGGSATWRIEEDYFVLEVSIPW